MTSDLMKKLLSGSVRLPEESAEMTFLNVALVDGKIKLDFGAHVLLLEPEGALQLAEILIDHAAKAKG